MHCERLAAAWQSFELDFTIAEPNVCCSNLTFMVALLPERKEGVSTKIVEGLVFVFSCNTFLMYNGNVLSHQQYQVQQPVNKVNIALPRLCHQSRSKCLQWMGAGEGGAVVCRPLLHQPRHARSIYLLIAGGFLPPYQAGFYNTGTTLKVQHTEESSISIQGTFGLVVRLTQSTKLHTKLHGIGSNSLIALIILMHTSNSTPTWPPTAHHAAIQPPSMCTVIVSSTSTACCIGCLLAQGQVHSGHIKAKSSLATPLSPPPTHNFFRLWTQRLCHPLLRPPAPSPAPKVLSQSLECQVHAAQAPFWPKDKCIVVPNKPKAPLPSTSEAQTSSRPEKLSQQGQLLEKALLAAAAAVLEHAQELDESDQR